jgi:hypothetical protein
MRRQLGAVDQAGGVAEHMRQGRGDGAGGHQVADILEQIGFTPKALRADLAGQKVSAGRLYSAAELISHAADLCSEWAGRVHGNERRQCGD